MSRSSWSLVLASVTLAALVGCGSEDPSPPSGSDSKQGSPSGGSGDKEGASTSATEPELGPSCEAYLACCEELAAKTPAAAGACDSTKSAIASAQKNGASLESYESACKSGLETAKSVGYCK